jgi:hypothetical protein
MDSNTLILLLGGACAVVLVVVLTLVANLLMGWRRDKANKKQQEGDIARWLTVRDSHTREIASLRAELSSVKSAKNGELKDTQRIWDRLRELEASVKALQDRPAPRRRSRDDDDDEDDDDRYVAPRRRSARTYR